MLSFPMCRNPFKDLDHSSSEDEGPHEKAARAESTSRGKFDFIKRVDRGITTVKDLES